MWPGPPTGLRPGSWSPLERAPGQSAWEHQHPQLTHRCPCRCHTFTSSSWPSGRGGLATKLWSWFWRPLRSPSIEKGTTSAAGMIARESCLRREKLGVLTREARRMALSKGVVLGRFSRQARTHPSQQMRRPTACRPGRWVLRGQGWPHGSDAAGPPWTSGRKEVRTAAEPRGALGWGGGRKGEQPFP